MDEIQPPEISLYQYQSDGNDVILRSVILLSYCIKLGITKI